MTDNQNHHAPQSVFKDLVRQGLATTTVIATGAFLLSAASGFAADHDFLPGTNSSLAADKLDGLVATLKSHMGHHVFTPPGPAFDLTKLPHGAKVVVINNGPGIAPLAAVTNGILEAAKETGIAPTLLTGGSNNTSTTANELLQHAVDLGPAVILQVGITTPLEQTGLQYAKAHNIPVVGVSERQPDPNAEGQGSGPLVTATSADSMKDQGKLIADFVAAVGPAGATIGVIGSDSLPSATEVRDSFIAELKVYCPDCKVVYQSVDPADWTTKLGSTASSMLLSNPTMEWFFPTVDGMASFVTPAVNASGRAKELKVVTTSGTPGLAMKSVKSGLFAAEAGEASTMKGWYAWDAALRIVMGLPNQENPVEPTTFFTTQSMNAEKLDPNDQVSLYGDEFKDGFRKLWGIKEMTSIELGLDSMRSAEHFERLEVRDVCKRLGAVQALDGVSLCVRAGTVHGVIGHNGSGKSTLAKVLSGVLGADQGSIAAIDVSSKEGTLERAPRVATVFQDLGLAHDFTVMENLLVNSYRSGRFGLLDIGAERSRAKAVLENFGLDVPLDLEVRKLRERERILLCVARAMLKSGIESHDDSHGSAVDLIILDEPTSSLPREELEGFRKLVDGLRKRPGLATMIITHNPGDIAAICDEFTALKSGRVIASETAKGVSQDRIAELMAGKQLAAPVGLSMRGHQSQTDAIAALSVNELIGPGLSRPVSLGVAAGEVLGVTGLEGSGFREFIETAMGIRPGSAGSVLAAGKEIGQHTEQLVQAGVVYIPADRQRMSGIPLATAYENMTLGRLDPFCRAGFIDVASEARAVKQMMERLRINPADPARMLGEMSGGQQQKVVVGRALLAGGKLFVFDEPTAAVDVGAREEILGFLREAANTGVGVVVSSAEFEWMPQVCDRLIVFREGAIAGELTGNDRNEAAILRLAYGAPSADEKKRAQ